TPILGKRYSLSIGRRFCLPCDRPQRGANTFLSKRNGVVYRSIDLFSLRQPRRRNSALSNDVRIFAGLSKRPQRADDGAAALFCRAESVATASPGPRARLPARLSLSLSCPSAN